MKRAPTPASLALSLALLCASCATSQVQVAGVADRPAASEGGDTQARSPGRLQPSNISPPSARLPSGGATQAQVLPMGQRERVDGHWLLLFPPRPRSSALEALSLEEVRPLLAALAPLTPRASPRVRLLEAPEAQPAGQRPAPRWETRLREDFLSRFGPPLLPLPESLASGRLLLALQLSTRYMAEGVREAAIALFTSPVFIASVCLSIIVYFSAWLAPEPLFSKAFAATLTLRLSLAVGLVELGQVALNCLRLYQEAEAASTPQQLEAASERFGKAMGGTSLRVLVTVGTLGLTRFIPQVPEGGLWGLLPSTSPEGVVLLQQSISTAQVVADGALIVSGVAAGTAACSGLALCATHSSGGASRGAPALSTRYGKPHTRQNSPHNEAIENELAAREAAGHADLRKNRPQVSADRKLVEDPKPVRGTRFRKPDASSTRPDGIRHNINYVSNRRDLKRELEAFDSMVRADPSALHELYLLDGTLVRRHIPAGLSVP